MKSKQIITYSPAYTLVPTYECFNHCSYCNFRTDPEESPWLTITEAEKILRQLTSQNISEILILSGEVHPNSSRRKKWFELIYNLGKLAMDMGFYPHTNVGILSWEEMEKLRQVNVSLGLMLEQLSPKLQTTVHRYAPSKQASLRLQQLEWAGELKIPFTTGILLGIGETEEECWHTLQAIALIQQRWGHIQEVIIQPYSVGQKQNFIADTFNLNKLPKIITKAREILPNNITIQIPPNLVSQPKILLECILAGARDLGGICPKDEVNPDYAHLNLQYLGDLLAGAGWELTPRLPIYPQYYNWVFSENSNH